ncbi:MAG TPA: FliM/FliN family flagellar motor switch protein, partial [Polyangiaceae bacterium]|nr:FliM/FliN family flagellar motor switch protein [Polyangiaceae bacterium]
LPGERCLGVRATVMIGGDAFAARALVHLKRPLVSVAPPARQRLASLGDLPLRLTAIAAVSTAEASEIHALAPGDVWMPGKGWLDGHLVLAAGTAERGIGAKLGEKGEIVVVGIRAVGLDAEAPMGKMADSDQTATSEVALDAPLVVRVELGAVTMPAREWADLAPGDVIGLGRRVGEPAILRVAGIEVARGELVDIEGELGVRIRERVTAT